MQVLWVVYLYCGMCCCFVFCWLVGCWIVLCVGFCWCFVDWSELFGFGGEGGGGFCCYGVQVVFGSGGYDCCEQIFYEGCGCEMYWYVVCVQFDCEFGVQYGGFEVYQDQYIIVVCGEFVDCGCYCDGIGVEDWCIVGVDIGVGCDLYVYVFVLDYLQGEFECCFFELCIVGDGDDFDYLVLFVSVLVSVLKRIVVDVVFGLRWLVLCLLRQFVLFLCVMSGSVVLCLVVVVFVVVCVVFVIEEFVVSVVLNVLMVGVMVLNMVLFFVLVLLCVMMLLSLVCRVVVSVGLLSLDMVFVVMFMWRKKVLQSGLLVLFIEFMSVMLIVFSSLLIVVGVFVVSFLLIVFMFLFMLVLWFVLLIVELSLVSQLCFFVMVVLKCEIQFVRMVVLMLVIRCFIVGWGCLWECFIGVVVCCLF